MPYSDKEKQKKAIYIGAKRHRIAQRQALNKYKMSRGCAVCGYNGHPEALEFDHLPGSDKKSTVAMMCDRSSWEALMKEVAKCQVLCANCHAIATAERRRTAREVKRQAKLAEQQLKLFA